MPMGGDVFAKSVRLPPVFDAARAERTFEGLGNSVSGIPARARDVLESAFGNSPYLCRLALRDCGSLHELWEGGPERVVEQAVRDAALAHEAADAAEAMAVL